jgi:hypothetical protein
MKYAKVEDIAAKFPHTILPTVQGELDYQTIHAIRKLLQANAQSIDTHLGGGALGNLGSIVCDASYAIVSPTGENGPILWVNPTAPGRAPTVIDQGTTAQLSAARHSWEEAVLTFRTYKTVQKSLEKQIFTVFEPKHLDILNDDMVGLTRRKQRTRLGPTSKFTLLQRTAITCRCRGNQPPTQAIMQQTQLLVKLNIKWLKPPLALWPTWQLQQQHTASSWQL